MSDITGNKIDGPNCVEAELETLLWLYLKGISTGDYSEALQALLGEQHKLRDYLLIRIEVNAHNVYYVKLSLCTTSSNYQNYQCQ